MSKIEEAEAEKLAARDNLDIAEARWNRARENVEKVKADHISGLRSEMFRAEQSWFASLNQMDSSTYHGRSRTDELRRQAFAAKAAYDMAVRELA